MCLLDQDRVEGRAVAVIDRALLETQQAFDGVAADYHRSNLENPLLCAMRERTLAALAAQVRPGARILNLGCGPGSDDEVLARQGHRVTAIDWSPAMVAEARCRIQRAGLEDRVDVYHLGIHELDRLRPAVFDAACSNFGPLNCVPSLTESARLIAERVRAGGVLVASVIGRVCPWELALYSWRRNWGRLRVRFVEDAVPVPLSGRTVWTRYYTPAAFERAFVSAGFARVSLRALGLFVPPPYMQAFAGRHPALIARLQWLDDRLGYYPGLRQWGDHFLMVLRKT
jgi:SAM-dependent methyltransferase